MVSESKSIVVVIAIVVIFVIIAVVAGIIIMKPEPEPVEPVEPEPVYEVDVGGVRFRLEKARDLGDILRFLESKNPKRTKEDLITTERFIEVTISAENIAKDNIASGTWKPGRLFDSKDRRFYYSTKTDYWTPEENKCGEILKPKFAPIMCTKIYEVSKISTDLRIEVIVKKEQGFLDLGILFDE